MTTEGHSIVVIHHFFVQSRFVLFLINGVHPCAKKRQGSGTHLREKKKKRKKTGVRNASAGSSYKPAEEIGRIPSLSPLKVPTQQPIPGQQQPADPVWPNANANSTPWSGCQLLQLTLSSPQQKHFTVCRATYLHAQAGCSSCGQHSLCSCGCRTTSAESPCCLCVRWQQQAPSCQTLIQTCFSPCMK